MPARAAVVAHDVLHVMADQHGQREHDPTGEEHRGEGRQPVAVAEQAERHHRLTARRSTKTNANANGQGHGGAEIRVTMDSQPFSGPP